MMKKLTLFLTSLICSNAVTSAAQSIEPRSESETIEASPKRWAEIKKGDSIGQVKAVLGAPERKGKTAFGENEWVYPNKLEPAAQKDPTKQKIWVVFDKNKKVTMVTNIYLCFLSHQ